MRFVLDDLSSDLMLLGQNCWLFLPGACHVIYHLANIILRKNCYIFVGSFFRSYNYYLFINYCHKFCYLSIFTALTWSSDAPIWTCMQSSFAFVPFNKFYTLWLEQFNMQHRTKGAQSVIKCTVTGLTMSYIQ